MITQEVTIMLLRHEATTPKAFSSDSSMALSLVLL